MGDTSRQEIKAFMRTSMRALTPLIAIAIFGTGCATNEANQRAKEQELTAMQSRIEEVERTNGRLTVRMEELEDQLFLLNDRVESHRIALQRRAYQERYAARAPRAPDRAPESSYYPDDRYGGGGSAYARPKPQRPVKRIQLADPSSEPRDAHPAAYGSRGSSASAGEEEVVITEDQYRAFAGPERRAPAKAQPSRSSSSGGRRAQPDVTSERLATTGQKGSASPAPTKKVAEKSAATSAPVKRPSSSGLRLYKDSLAHYRGGEYASALAGFEAFLASKPKQDYVDNALYWIGECHYGLGDFSRAVNYFERVMKEQPDGNKVPDSMLKMSLALDQMGQGERAAQVLETLTRRYPMTNAAQLGQKRLANRD